MSTREVVLQVLVLEAAIERFFVVFGPFWFVQFLLVTKGHGKKTHYSLHNSCREEPLKVKYCAYLLYCVIC